MGSQLLLVLAFVYAALLFLAAWRAEHRVDLPRPLQSLIYSLSLAVYCSSWTFFGAVGRTVDSGWSYFPIYLGPICLFLFGSRFLRRLLIIGSRNKVTSIADFIGSRYGKQQSLASMVTLVAVIGSLPYIALQLKAVALAWSTVDLGGGELAQVTDSGSLIAALIMAWFAIIFGTRVIDGPRRHRGMVAAIALESLVKLIAFVVLGLMAVSWLGADFISSTASILPLSLEQFGNINFFTQTLLAMIAIVCLPRQFHVMVVEYHSRSDFKLARWLFPLYLLLFSVFVLPIAAAGMQTFSGSAVSPEMYVLSLPMASGSFNLAALVFIGGLSAATGMIVVATITLSIMISNELVVPIWLRISQKVALVPADLGTNLRYVRRFSIVAILLLGWLLERALVGNAALASLGLISFAAAAQLLPAIIAGLYWQRGHRNGVLAGLSIGSLCWFYCLLLPAIIGPEHNLVMNGPGDIAWLAPVSLLGFGWLDPLSHGVFWSLLLNTLVFITVSKYSRFNALDLRQANAFTQLRHRQQFRQQDFELTGIEIRQLQGMADPLMGSVRRDQIWQGFEQRLGHRLLPHDRAPRFIVSEVEAALASIIGAVSAHRFIQLLRKQKPLQIEDFAHLVGGTSRQIQFSQELLLTTLETIPQGISVVDDDLKLVAWNQRYLELFSYPPRLLYVGCPIARIYEFNASRGYMGSPSDDVDAEVEKRLRLIAQARDYRIERRLPNGTVIEINGTPIGNGGYVTTYTDITEYQSMLDELETAKARLEDRVEERTAELSAVNISLQHENDLRGRLEKDLNEVYASKSRFLTAASHDLLQPINAARLFVASVQQKAQVEDLSSISNEVDHIDGALGGAEQLISSLREIARLDSGKLTPNRQAFAVTDLLQALANEFSLMADRNGLEFRWVDCGEWVYSDEQLLRRILQNFLSNALRYTSRGKVLLGCRRRDNSLLIEVWDTGLGIVDQDRERIFEEFERLGSANRSEGEKGLGLGLSIAQRMARLLGHSLEMDSTPARGSVFRVVVPLTTAPEQVAAIASVSLPAGEELAGQRVLCIDNELRILAGMQSLLEQWGCQVICATSLADAIERWPFDEPPHMVLADYHLDDGENGLDLLQALGYHWQRSLDAIVISADNSEALCEQVREEGYYYLPKPVQAAALRSTMRALIRRQPS